MKILLATDGSECAEAAVHEVASRPWPEPTDVRVVSAMEPASLLAMPETWGPPTDYYDMMEKGSEARARQAVESAVKRLQSAVGSLRVTSDVVRGLPKEAILHEAERWGADWIVVGSHGYRGFRRLWLGSVSQAISAHARCSVLIVRHPDDRHDTSR
jgi:nucleotide-binding universal stress UspA family protein